jgi:opacity protein-like surface antigen
MDAHIAALRDSLSTVRGEMDALRSEMALVSARADRLADSVVQLNRRFNIFRNRSIFGNSGFYLGLGTGVTYTAAGLHDIGYVEGLQVTVPLGWHKPGNLIGVRTEWAWQNVDGRNYSGFGNVDPNIYSGTAMLSLHIPFNSAKTHNIYLMGGGGMYMFRDFQPQSSLAAAFAGSQDAPTSETKWGLTAGAGVQFHVLGATSIFVQTQWNQVAADRAVAPATTRTLGWIPLVAGVTLR